MTQYIDKSAVIAEIEDIESFALCEYNSNKTRYAEGSLDALHRLKYSIDCLDVKEVNINKEISQFIDANFGKATIGQKLSLRRVAKHFFELGLKVKGE